MDSIKLASIGATPRPFGPQGGCIKKSNQTFLEVLWMKDKGKREEIAPSQLKRGRTGEGSGCCTQGERRGKYFTDIHDISALLGQIKEYLDSLWTLGTSKAGWFGTLVCADTCCIVQTRQASLKSQYSCDHSLPGANDSKEIAGASWVPGCRN